MSIFDSKWYVLCKHCIIAAETLTVLYRQAKTKYDTRIQKLPNLQIAIVFLCSFWFDRNQGSATLETWSGERETLLDKWRYVPSMASWNAGHFYCPKLCAYGWMGSQYTLQTVQWLLDDLFPSVTVPSHRIRRQCLVWAAFGVGAPADVRYQNCSNFWRQNIRFIQVFGDGVKCLRFRKYLHASSWCLLNSGWSCRAKQFTSFFELSWSSELANVAPTRSMSLTFQQPGLVRFAKIRPTCFWFWIENIGFKMTESTQRDMVAGVKIGWLCPPKCCI